MGLNDQIFEEAKGESDTLAGLILELKEKFHKKMTRLYFIILNLK